jgi:parvulin-like peptidyl-prolyl isomerase
MKSLIRFIAFVLMIGSAYAQSNLPACRGSDVSKWINCYGTAFHHNLNTNKFRYIVDNKQFNANFHNRFEGEFKDGLPNGKGTFIFANGNVYVGELKDDKFNGQGTFTSASGAQFVGEYKDGRKDGRGILTYSDRSKYVGEFKNDKFNGQGVEYASNGSVINQGIWVDGDFVRSSPLQQANVTNNAVSESLAKSNYSLKSSHILVESAPEAAYLYQEIQAAQGNKVAKFQELANRFSKDPGSNKNGGQLGWSAKGAFVAEYEKVANELKVGEISMPFKTQFGWHIMYVEDKNVQETTVASSQPSIAERDRLTSELDLERKKRQELEAQLASSVQPTQPQSNTQRLTAHALVIGNAAYPGSGRLDNPVNDANAISQKLRSMGFTVTTVTDANRQRLVQSMAQFRRTAASADISLLYYAGHGVQIFGTNYILPTDVDQTDPAQATIQGVSLNSVVENFLPGKTKLVFLDACRDNALQRTNDRSVSKGLAPISTAEGTLISYATKDGQTAADGVRSKNSPFTQALLEHLNDPQDIAVVLRKVRERVMKITGGKQQPWEYGSLTGGELVLSAIRQK